MISRTLAARVQSKIGSGKAIIITGPRQVGKTTLILDQIRGKSYKFFDGDDPVTRRLLDTPNTQEIRSLLEEEKVVFIDEAQRIENIGLTLKIITDQMKDVQLWVSGSSSFSLFNELNEPLTGRKWEYEMFPISWEEYQLHVGYLESEQQLANRIRFGMYPEVVTNPGAEVELLRSLVSSYLYKDVMAYAGIRKPEVLDKLVQALALQIGSEVNSNELSRLIGIDRNTVENYLSILEKAYVIFKLPSYSRNVRNEIKKGKKVYFYDTGIRNAIIGNFNNLGLRNDTGHLWENFLVAERIKQIEYKMTLARSYFWRTTQQQEIDYVEDVGTDLTAYKFKWSPGKKTKIPETFTAGYGAEGKIISRDNFRDFVIVN
ncbi:ATP-binding protein [Neolewinella sp.]|uniref:ATP-binding protein n=1 Tax=Neolewinella sp. TaxID=2993543 RepID=UPI003B52B304